MINMHLGTWQFPSGNSCDVRAEQDTAGMSHWWFAWDSPPPLSAEDYDYYIQTVLPSVMERLGSLSAGGHHGEA